MHWSAADVVAATGGSITRGNPDVAIDGVTIDSREGAEGRLFVPIVAERDGHRFVAGAVGAGAVAYLHVPGALTDLPDGATAIEVAETAVALTALGRTARGRLAGPVVGITGSVGKTSTKDLTAGALASQLRVAASERSFNNELGVPLTLANAADDTEVAVIEMGARGPGHIRMLCGIAEPTIGVVTAVVAAHTEMFGSVDAIAVAKGELIEALPPSGHAVLNADDERVAAMASRSSAPVLRWSATGRAAADVVATDVSVDDRLRPRFGLRSAWGNAEVVLEARGLHQVSNALAAASVALLSGVDLDAVVAGLAGAALSPWRMEVGTTAGGATLLNDAYNANPTSMAAALEGLHRLPAERRIAVLGEMAELGDRSAEEHQAVAELARSLGISVVAVGTGLYGDPSTVSAVASVEDAAAAVGDLGPGVAVLVKGSRVAGLERLAGLLGA